MECLNVSFSSPKELLKEFKRAIKDNCFIATDEKGNKYYYDNLSNIAYDWEDYIEWSYRGVVYVNIVQTEDFIDLMIQLVNFIHMVNKEKGDDMVE